MLNDHSPVGTAPEPTRGPPSEPAGADAERVLWLNPFSGLSGDMLLGALLDLGAPIDAVRAAIASTGIEGWRLDVERIDARGLMATRAVVSVAAQPAHRRAGELLELVEGAAGSVSRVAGRAIRAIAEVEGRLHGVPSADVHLHEVGGIDTVVDTVGVASAIELLGVQAVRSSPPSVGGGMVTTAHGLLPVPAPATAALLAGAPIRAGGIDAELVTPTGAALLVALDTTFEPLPPFVLEATGYGAGSRVLPDRPNVLPASIGECRVGSTPAVVLETNVDDVTGEVLAHVIERALDAGASDAWVTPAVMKKGRPAHTIHVLASAELGDALGTLLLAETGSLGLRRWDVDKRRLPRSIVTVDVEGYPVRVKTGPWRAKPEHDDLEELARHLGEPLRAAADRTMTAYRAMTERPD